MFGLGASGVAAANLLARRGKSVVATDPGRASRPSDLDDAVEFRAGANDVAGAEVVVASPGLKPSNAAFAGVSVPVISEIELGWSACDLPFIGITGTDGKTTTTELTTHILQHAGERVIAAGNIGLPLTAVIEEPLDRVVVEVSAFQLWSTHQFSVEVGAYTNIAPDHLDYFDSWSDYVAAKHLLAVRSRDATFAFNWDDPVVRGWCAEHGGPATAYSVLGEPDVDLNRWWVDQCERSIRVNGDVAFDLAEFEANGFFGVHNFANFMAAASMAHTVGVSLDAIREAMTTFKVGRHRVEFCGVVNGVAYYDDSKATNAHASIAGIRALRAIRPPATRLAVIAGGVDKGLDLGELSALLVAEAAHVVLIGEVQARFADALAAAGHPSVELATTMEEAVALAAVRGDTVLLSPACSSFDMFDSYAHRGEVFQRALNQS